MTVSRSHHLRVVYSLIAVIVVCALLLAVVVCETGIVGGPHAEPPHATTTDVASMMLDAPSTPFPEDEEAVIIEGTSDASPQTVLPVTKLLFEYVEVVGSCGPHYEGECLRVRAGPGTDFPIVTRLRNAVVLKVAGRIERNGEMWYKVVFDEWLRFPERVTSDWYIRAEFARVLLDEGIRTLDDEQTKQARQFATTSTKRIVVDRTLQTLSAFEGDALFMEEKISTGLELTPTPAGVFTIFRKTPSRYMQGPIADVSDQYYDLPGVPWNLYFTHGGAVIHGAYWHTSFGTKYSHGCVNLPPDAARKLYYWADLGTKVTVTG